MLNLSFLPFRGDLYVQDCSIRLRWHITDIRSQNTPFHQKSINSTARTRQRVYFCNRPPSYFTSNGAYVHNSQNDIIFQQHLPQKIIAGIIEMVKNDDEIIINIYRNDDWLVNKEDTKTDFNHDNFTYSFFDIDNPPLENVAKIFLTREDQDHNKLVIWEDKIKAKFSDRANIVFSSPSCLEIMDAGVSKGHALDAVAKMKGYQLKDCIAFGDGMNDFEMLSMAGKGLVMATAHHKVKMALPDHEVIGCCDDQAVAHYLVKHLLD